MVSLSALPWIIEGGAKFIGISLLLCIDHTVSYCGHHSLDEPSDSRSDTR